MELHTDLRKSSTLSPLLRDRLGDPPPSPSPHNEEGIKLFGVRLTEGLMMRKAVSMGNLSSYNSASSMLPPQSSTPEQSESGDPHGYVSDSLVQNSASLRARKKGVAWTEEEHRRFLVGLQKLGKGDWRGISRAFVPSRTPTQVASHAQKYFLRQKSLNKRKRRSSLFDINGTGVHASSLPPLHFTSEQPWLEGEIISPSAGMAASSPTAASSPITSSLCRIDEASDLSANLKLSIGPPLHVEPMDPLHLEAMELTLKLEQPNSGHNAQMIGANKKAAHSTISLELCKEQCATWTSVSV